MILIGALGFHGVVQLFESGYNQALETGFFAIWQKLQKHELRTVPQTTTKIKRTETF